MTDKKKSIVEEALLDINKIHEALNTNATEILRTVAIGEIDGLVKESINEDLYDEEDVDDEAGLDAGADMGAGAEGPMGAEPEMGGDDFGAEAGADEAGDLGGLDMGAEEEGLDGLGGEEGGLDDYEMDMTGASDDDVLSVYKKLSGDDEIEIVSDNEVIIKDPVSGAEYNVKLGGGDSSLAGGLDMGAGADDMGAGDSMAPAAEPEMGGGEEDGLDGLEDAGDDAEGDDMGAEAPAAEPEADDSADEEGDDDDEVKESVVFEIAMGDDEETIEEDIVRGKGHDKHLTTTTMDKGDIEGTKAEKDADTGDNLTGGFDDDAVPHAHAEGPMVMGENEDLEEGSEEEAPLEEAIPVGNAQGRRLPGKETPIKGAGAKSLEEANKRYGVLLAEAKRLQAQNEDYKNAIGKWREALGKSVIFNTNLTNVVRLFQEHSTTLEEKQVIVARFDRQATTIKESKKLYKIISSELGSKTPIRESVENKIIKEGASSQSTQLNETTAYVDQSTKRIIDLFRRVENK